MHLQRRGPSTLLGTGTPPFSIVLHWAAVAFPLQSGRKLVLSY